jgi:hypothetical protein
VQTILPELKIKVAVLGVLSLKTKPGNWSGWYSTSTKFFVIWLRSTVWFIEAEATTFSMLTIALVWGIARAERVDYIRSIKGGSFFLSAQVISACR